MRIYAEICLDLAIKFKQRKYVSIEKAGWEDGVYVLWRVVLGNLEAFKTLDHVLEGWGYVVLCLTHTQQIKRVEWPKISFRKTKICSLIISLVKISKVARKVLQK